MFSQHLVCTIIMQLKEKRKMFPFDWFIFMCFSENSKQTTQNVKINISDQKCKRNTTQYTNIATLLFNNSHNTSIGGVCQFLDLLTINHSLPDSVQRGVSFTVNLPLRRAHMFSIGLRSGEEGFRSGEEGFRSGEEGFRSGEEGFR